MSVLKATIQCDLIIPVYNRPDQVRDLWQSLIRNTDFSYIRKIILADDASDSTTQGLLAKLAASSQAEVEISRAETNQGFLKNCNHAYGLTSAPVVVLLNTDTLLPPGWISRLLAPFLAQPEIALATPLSSNAANLTVLRLDGQSWLDLDLMMSRMKPSYPDACTAVGFCMAMRREALDADEPLFDEVYGLGYGEESDLHYRLLKKGRRSVIVDDLLVHHAGGASFLSVLDVSERIQANRKVFFERWGSIHNDLEKKWNQDDPLGSRRNGTTSRNRFRLRKQELDFLFVLPTVTGRYGGIKVVIELVDRLNLAGYRGGIFCEAEVDTAFQDSAMTVSCWRAFPDLVRDVSRIGTVIATDASSVRVARHLSDSLNAHLSYFVQGPENLFSCGVYFGKTLQDYKDIDSIFVITKYLSQHLGCLVGKEPPSMNLGPDPLVFYDRGLKRRPKSIAAALRMIPEKGTGQLLQFLWLAKQKGYEIHLFGHDCGKFQLPEGFATVHGQLSGAKLSTLLNQVEFYADFSLLEGLGLIPLEAAFSGAIPIVSHSGGADAIFEGGQDAIFIEDMLAPEKLLARIESLTSEERTRLRSGALQVSARNSNFHCVEAFQRFLEERHGIRPGLLEKTYREAEVYDFLSEKENLRGRLKWANGKFARGIDLAEKTMQMAKKEGINKTLAWTLKFVGNKLEKRT